MALQTVEDAPNTFNPDGTVSAATNSATPPPSAPAVPDSASYSPSATPYTAPVAPDLPAPPPPPKPPVPTPDPTQRDLAFGGGTKGVIGTIATMADSLLKGAMMGREKAQAKQVAAASKLMSGYQGANEALGNKAMDIIQQPEIKSILRKQLADPKTPLTPAEIETIKPFTDAVGQSDSVWTAWDKMRSNNLTGGNSGGKTKGKSKGKDTDEPPSMPQAMSLFASKDPNEKLKGAAMMATLAGNPLHYKIKEYLSQPDKPQAQQSPKEQQDALWTSINHLSAKPNRTDAENADLKSQTDRYNAGKVMLEATPKTTAERPTGKPFLRDGKWFQPLYDPSTNSLAETPMPEGWKPPPVTAPLRKPDHFDDFKAQVAREAGFDPKDISASSLLALNRAFSDSHKTGSFSNGVYHYQDTATGQEVEVPITRSTPAPAINVPKVTASQGATPVATAIAAPAVPAISSQPDQVKHTKSHVSGQSASASAANHPLAPRVPAAPTATSNANTLPPGSPKGARVIGSTASAAEKMDAREIIAAGKDARSLDAALATMDDYMGGIKSGTVKRDPRKDLDLMIGAVRAMNPGSRRLPQTELKMEIEAGSWDQVMGRKLSVWSKGYIPDDQRTSLYNILKDETTKFATSVTRDYETKLPQLTLPDHLKRYATKKESGSGMGASLSDARKLPFNKNKSDAEITKDLESRGHTVLP